MSPNRLTVSLYKPWLPGIQNSAYLMELRELKMITHVNKLVHCHHIVNSMFAAVIVIILTTPAPSLHSFYSPDDFASHFPGEIEDIKYEVPQLLLSPPVWQMAVSLPIFSSLPSL